MFIVLLRFSDARENAGQFMDGHNAWIRKGFEDGKFLLAGSLQPQQGGSVIAHNISLDDLKARVNEDPFVAEKVVRAEILEIAPARIDERLRFLAG